MSDAVTATAGAPRLSCSGSLAVDAQGSLCTRRYRMSFIPTRGACSRLLIGLAGVQLLSVLAACGGTTTGGSAPSATVEVARPSNAGGPGQAATLPGDAT